MDVRVLGVEVRSSHPFQASPEVFLHACKELPRLVLQIETVTELRRDNYFEDPLVAGTLPCVQNRRNVDVCPRGIKTCGRCVVALRGAVPRNVMPVRFPLAGGLVLRVGHADGDALSVESRGRWAAGLGLQMGVGLAMALRHLGESEN